MAESLRKPVVGRFFKKLPGRKPMTPAEFQRWLRQHSPFSAPRPSSFWRSVTEEAPRVQGSWSERLIEPESPRLGKNVTDEPIFGLDAEWLFPHKSFL